MQDELYQFERNQVWDLVSKPINNLIIGTRWVFRNKLVENRMVLRNKVRLVTKWHNQEKGINFSKTYEPITRLKAIRMLLVYACYIGFKLY